MKRFSLVKAFIILTLCTSLIFIFNNGLQLKNSNTNVSEFFGNNSERINNLSTDLFIKFFEVELPMFSSIMHQDYEVKETLFAMSADIPYEWVINEVPYLAATTDDSNEISRRVDDKDIVMEIAPPDKFFEAEKENEIKDVEEETIRVINNDEKVVFIYHTHNRESFLPELNTEKANEAYDQSINVTLVGERLAEELCALGIGTVISKKDYWPDLEDYALSYKYSRETVMEAISQYGDYPYIFDIHRDASSRDKTTRSINGKDYAAIYIVIGEGNKNYKQNLELAKDLENTLEELYPGLSKGILSKEKTAYTNGDYNQSVSGNALTLEIGGIYNTLEEEYRTVEALAEAIGYLYWDATMVSGEIN